MVSQRAHDEPPLVFTQVYTDSSRLLQSGLDRYLHNGMFSDVVVLTPAGKRIKYVPQALASLSSTPRMQHAK